MKKKVIPSAKCICFLALFANSFFTYSQQDYYWVGGSGNWSDFSSHWATSSGGTEFHTSSPTSTDNVYFDANSFTAEGQVVTMDVGANCLDMMWEGVTFSPGFESNTTSALQVYGSLHLENLSFFRPGHINIRPASGTVTVETNGIGFSESGVFFFPQNGSISLLDSISAKTVSFVNISKNFSSNGNAIHTSQEFSLSLSINGEINLANSAIYTKNFRITSNLGTNGVLNMDGSTVSIIYPDGYTRIDKTKHPNPLVHSYIIQEDHRIINENPIFDQLILEPGVELLIHDFIDGVEFNKLIANGTIEDPISIKSLNETSMATLIHTGGDNEVFFTEFQDIEVVGEATFNAYASTDLGNVTGVNFFKLDQNLTFDIEGKDFEDINEVFTLPEQTDVELPIFYTVENEEVAEVINGNELIIKGLGVTRIIASQAGNEFYNAATPVERFLEVAKADQVITFSEIENTWVGEEFVNLNTSVSSGLAIDYQVSGPATANGSVLEFSGTGTVQVIASQSGNENYNAAEPVIRSFEVFKKEQVITFSEIPDTSEDAGFVNLDAVSDSGLPITYSVVGPAEEVDGVLEFTGNGMVQVKAIQMGNDLYLPAEDINRAFEILASETEKPLFLTQPEGLGLVYPNPVADYIYFDPKLNIEAVQVSDLSGKVLFYGELKDDHIDVSSWDTGNYIFLIRTVEGEEITTRIIRN